MSDKATTRSVLVVGSANMDMVVSTSRFPSPGETVLARDFGTYPGGKGANQAVACAKLGGDVTLLAKMGRDMFRERLFDSLRADGVNLDHVSIDPTAPTGIALITVDDSGQNEIVVVSGSNMKLTPEDVESKAELFDGVGIVILQLEIPLETVVRSAQLAKERGAEVILNPAPATELPDVLLEAVDYIIPNESEAERLTGVVVGDHRSAIRAAHRLIERGVGHVILTLGERGVLYVTSDDVRSFPAYRVDVVDTTAAGDAFTGALAFFLSRGQVLEDAISYSNAVAGYCVMRMGAQTSMPSFDEIQTFLRDQPEPVLEGGN